MLKMEYVSNNVEIHSYIHKKKYVQMNVQMIMLFQYLHQLNVVLLAYII